MNQQLINRAVSAAIWQLMRRNPPTKAAFARIFGT